MGNKKAGAKTGISPNSGLGKPGIAELGLLGASLPYSMVSPGAKGPLSH